MVSEILVEKGNPDHITSVKDLANSAVKVVVCAPAVPCGQVATAIFKNAGVTVKPVSEEQNVGGVVTKVTLGEADAGIVYVTDVNRDDHRGPLGQHHQRHHQQILARRAAAVADRLAVQHRAGAAVRLPAGPRWPPAWC